MNVIIIITGVFILLVVGYLFLSGSKSPPNTSSASIKISTRISPGYYQPRVSGVQSSSGSLVTSSE